ncbi:MAG: non-canonical purine NTP pyrophosphatase [Dysosmobacter sp.]
MSAILQGLGIEVLSMEEAGVHTQPEEDGDTFEENALIKARAASQGLRPSGPGRRLRPRRWTLWEVHRESTRPAIVRAATGTGSGFCSTI